MKCLWLKIVFIDKSYMKPYLGSPLRPIGNKPWLNVVGAKPKLKIGNGILGIGIPKMDRPSSSPDSSDFSLSVSVILFDNWA